MQRAQDMMQGDSPEDGGLEETPPVVYEPEDPMEVG